MILATETITTHNPQKRKYRITALINERAERLNIATADIRRAICKDRRISTYALSIWENRLFDNPGGILDHNLRIIAEVLGCKVDDLFTKPQNDKVL